jgi:hypothetical protein
MKGCTPSPTVRRPANATEPERLPAHRFGGLMSYSGDLRHQFRRAALYVDKILKRANPAELPVEQPTKYELVITGKRRRPSGSRSRSHCSCGRTRSNSACTCGAVLVRVATFG